MRFLFTRLIVISFILLFSLNSYAYQYFSSDCKWPDNTIEFYYNPTNQPAEYKTGDVETWIQYAAKQWSDKSGLIIRYKGITDKNPFNENDGYTVIGWADPESNYWKSGEEGKWSFYPKFTGAYVKYGTCNDNMKDMQMLLNTRRIKYGYKDQPKIQYWDGLITHEFGHVIGLAHNSYSNCNSVMAGGGTCGYKGTLYQKTLRTDDISGVIFKYPKSLKNSVCSNYPDVYKKEKYCTSIEYVTTKGWMHGYRDDSFFGDNQLVNRAELLKIIIKAAFDEKDYDHFSTEKCFSDVKPDEWYTKYVCFAKNKTIVRGYGNSGEFFKPSDTIKYVEALKIALIAFGYPGDENYGDNWYDTYISISKTIGLVEDIDKLTPLDRNVTRDFAAHLICRISSLSSCSGSKY